MMIATLVNILALSPWWAILSLSILTMLACMYAAVMVFPEEE